MELAHGACHGWAERWGQAWLGGYVGLDLLRWYARVRRVNYCDKSLRLSKLKQSLVLVDSSVSYGKLYFR